MSGIIKLNANKTQNGEMNDGDSIFIKHGKMSFQINLEKNFR